MRSSRRLISSRTFSFFFNEITAPHNTLSPPLVRCDRTRLRVLIVIRSFNILLNSPEAFDGGGTSFPAFAGGDSSLAMGEGRASDLGAVFKPCRVRLVLRALYKAVPVALGWWHGGTVARWVAR